MKFESKKHNGIYTGWTERHIFTLINTSHGKYSVYADVTEEYGGGKFDRRIPIADNVSRAEAEKICEEYDSKCAFRLDRSSDSKRLILLTENPYLTYDEKENRYKDEQWCVIHTEPNTNAGYKNMRKFLKENFASRFSSLEIED